MSWNPPRGWGVERIESGGDLTGVVVHLRLHRKIGRWEAFLRRDRGLRLGALLASAIDRDPLVAIDYAVAAALKINTAPAPRTEAKP